MLLFLLILGCMAGGTIVLSFILFFLMLLAVGSSVGYRRS
jgi:hypothetical protein